MDQIELREGINAKICNCCGVLKGTWDFALSKQGRLGRKTYCKKCRTKKRPFNPMYPGGIKASANKLPKKAVRDTKRENKIALVKMLGGKCIDCGLVYPPECFDFDHRDPETKSFNISQRLHCSMVLLIPEAQKCDLRCSNCHRVKTSLAAEWGKKPGTKTGRNVARLLELILQQMEQLKERVGQIEKSPVAQS